MGKLYVRVDDRLIHGQTIVAWCPTLRIEEIIAVDDASAQNPVLKSILTMGVPKNYVTNVVTTAEANALLEEKSDKNRLLIVNVPEKLGELGDNISDCEQLILGNMAKRPDTVHKISGATGIFYLSEADVKLLDNLAERGMDIVFHQLPNASKVTWKAFKETI